MSEAKKASGSSLMSIRGVTKSFGTNAVLKGINLEIARGEVLALIGGNGAGKSTLMKIIMGIYTLDEGEIRMDGQPIRLGKPAAALAQGIYLVPQEPLLFPNMTVRENILMGFKENGSELQKRLENHMKELGFKLNLQRKANTLSIAEQQLVEILRGLMREARMLILDEPTSALTFGEVQSLFKVVRDLKEKGSSIIYITHRLNEVFEIATDVAIMRDGQITLQGPVQNFTREMLIRGLLPSDAEVRALEHPEEREEKIRRDKPVLQVQHLSGYGFSDISFDLYPGEILGIAGVVGAGRTELISTIFGRDKVLGGKVLLEGKDITGLSTKQILKEGSNFVPPALPRAVQDPLRGLQYHLGPAERQGDRQGGYQSEKTEEYRPEIRGGIPDEDRHPGRPAGQPVRRQPAEGGHRPVPVHGAEGRDSRRAHPGHRRGGPQ